MSSNIWAIIFILIGLVLLLFMYNIISIDIFKDWWKLWPSIFIVLGIVIFLFRKEEKKIESVKA